MMLRTGKRRGPASGFTLVELIVVLAIIAIVSGLSVPWFSQMASGRRLGAAVREVVGVLQAARSYAITQGTPHSVVFEIDEDGRGDRYYVWDQDGQVVDKPFALPSGTKFFAPSGTPDPVTFKDHRAVFFNTGSASEKGSIWVFDGRNQYSKITVSELTGNVKVEDSQ